MKKRSKKAPLERPRLRRTIRTGSTLAEIELEISFRSRRITDTVYASLLPETLQPAGFRSRTNVRQEGRRIRLDIRAQDVVALRAATNSFLRFLSVAIKTVDIVLPFYSAGNRDFKLETLGKRFD